jgi:PEP-CTERM motif
MIRGFAVLLSIAAVLAIPSFAHASNLVTLNDYSGGNPDFINNATTDAGSGGAFTATTTGGGTLGDLSFITFCLEFNEEFLYGGTYNYDLSDGAKAGGVSGGIPHPVDLADPVDDATKWLYAEVVTGGYSSILAFGSGDVGARVQEAIWYIEGERLGTEIDAASQALAIYAQTNQTWSTFANLGFTVYAMNLTNPDGTPAQDQLAMTTQTAGDVPVPEPATLLLLGTGLLATSRFSRRKTRS